LNNIKSWKKVRSRLIIIIVSCAWFLFFDARPLRPYPSQGGWGGFWESWESVSVYLPTSKYTEQCTSYYTYYIQTTAAAAAGSTTPGQQHYIIYLLTDRYYKQCVRMCTFHYILYTEYTVQDRVINWTRHT